VAALAEAHGLRVDTSTSAALQESLARLEVECPDPETLQALTALLTAPMKPAEYAAAGMTGEEDRRHFALNIPYYTHFTSPIRRYADVVVHRLLQATVDGAGAVARYPKTEDGVHQDALHCNQKRMAAKTAQERSDRVYLAVYLRSRPLVSEVAIVTGMGRESFNVLVPSIGVVQRVQVGRDHPHLRYRFLEREKRMCLTPQPGSDCGFEDMDVVVFARILVSCHCTESGPVDVLLKIVGPCP